MVGFSHKENVELEKESELVGSINIIPMASPYATEVDSRVSPIDNLDLNRIFPGEERGTHSERLAAFIVREALNDVDILIDLHAGGSWCVNSFAFKFNGSESLAEAFEVPFIVDAVDRANTLQAMQNHVVRKQLALRWVADVMRRIIGLIRLPEVLSGVKALRVF